jgi:hypothetical protein
MSMAETTFYANSSSNAFASYAMIDGGDCPSYSDQAHDDVINKNA